MEFLTTIQTFFAKLLAESVSTFTEWMINLIPMILLVMIIMNTIALCIGEKRVRSLAMKANQNILIRYMLLPFLGAIVLCNPMALSLGKYVPEKHKPSYFASASFFCHTSSGVFQHINPSELMIWIGISQGVTKQGLPIYDLAWMYLVAGLFANFISGVLTDYTTKRICDSKGIVLDATLQEEEEIQPIVDKQVIIKKGVAGYGGPLTLQVEDNKNKIVYVTAQDRGLAIAEKIAALTGGEVINGVKQSVPDEEVMAAIIDCGGTLRCGIYPKKGIPTLNVLPTGKSGPLAKYINESIYVSDVSLESVLANEDAQSFEPRKTTWHFSFFVARLMSLIIEASKQAVDVMLKSIIPFLAAVSLLVGIISGSGVGLFIAEMFIPLVGNAWGLLLIGVLCSLPVLAPILSPGAVMAQVVGVFIGVQIGDGALPAYFALPALFAINTQAACDFIPVGLALAEAKPDTIQVGIPSILSSRFFSSAIRVLIAIGFSFFLYR